MNVKFTFTKAAERKPIVFDHIFAEKVGGGIVANSDFALQEGLAVGKNKAGKYAPIKAFIVYEDADEKATTIKIKKGSGVATSDILSNGKVAVAVTKVDSTAADFDTLTVSLGQAVTKAEILFAAKAASGEGVTIEPVYAPEYLLGEDIDAGVGDYLAKLVNGASVRKETAPVADFVVALMKGILKN